jgi:hypothetical protein
MPSFRRKTPSHRLSESRPRAGTRVKRLRRHWNSFAIRKRRFCKFAPRIND